MRADATRAENMLWQVLRGSNLEGFKFKRQVPLDGYILDFVCFETKLIVEVDGGQHSESMKDRERDAHFDREGFETLRFWNHEVETSLDAACDHILHRLRARTDIDSPLSGKNQGLGFTKPRFLLSPPRGGRYEAPPIAQVFRFSLRFSNEFNRIVHAPKKTCPPPQNLPYNRNCLLMEAWVHTGSQGEGRCPVVKHTVTHLGDEPPSRGGMRRRRISPLAGEKAISVD